MADLENAARERLATLYRAHSFELTRYALRRVGEAAAADVVSETFLIAWRRIEDVPAEHARAWLYATASFVIGHEGRGGRRRMQLQGRLEFERDQLVEADPAVAITARHLVESVLAQLSEQDRQVLRLAEWEQLSASEAALVLGCTATAFKVRLHRARKRFARLLGGHEAPDDEQGERLMPVPILVDEER